MNSRKEMGVIKRNAELKQQLAANAQKLKIEASLERVRVVALKMKKPADMLEVCKTISLQLQKLGVKEIRNVQTAIFYESKGTYMNYEYYSKHKKTIITETVYTDHKVAKAFAAKMLSGKGEVYITHIKGKKVKDWIAYQKTTNVFIDRFLEKTNSLNYYWHSLGPVALGISTYDPLSEEELSLFKRFVKVFELAYTRYLDIEQAIAQAREAQIEAAMEKIRGRSLAMHHSNELKDVIGIMYKKLDELKVLHGAVAIQLFNFETRDSIFWPGNILQKEAPKVILPYDENIMKEDTCHRDLWQAMEKGEVIFNKVYSKKKKDRWFQYVFANNDTGVIENHSRKFILQAEIHTVCFIPEKNSALFADSFDGSLFSEEEFKVLKRASKVFEQAYVRFLDLQKAEAQAREAQIEAALERVRSRTMGMQKSEELKEVIQVVYEQFVHLNIHVEHTGFVMDYKARDDYDIWIADQLGVPSHLIIPYFDCIYYNRFNEAKKNGENFFATNLDFEEKNIFYQRLFDYVPGLTEEAKKFYLNCP